MKRRKISVVLFLLLSAMGMEAFAHNAGVTPVGVLWGYRPLEELKEAGARFIIKKPNELLDLSCQLTIRP